VFLPAITEAHSFAARSSYKWIEDINAIHINKEAGILPVAILHGYLSSLEDN
jgi:hypothetical protein